MRTSAQCLALYTAKMKAEEWVAQRDMIFLMMGPDKMKLHDCTGDCIKPVVWVARCAVLGSAVSQTAIHWARGEVIFTTYFVHLPGEI